MSKELEIGGLASIGGWLKRQRKHADLPPGTPCPNCETALQGPYCHSCGQFAEQYHKSIWHLFVEVVESFTHFDGRLWRTLPNLLWRPGRLTRSYLDGKRASQVPPFRMFLIVLLIVFFAGQCSMNQRPDGTTAADLPGAAMPGTEKQAREAILSDPDLTEEERQQALAVVEGDWGRFGKMIADKAREESDKAEAEKAAAATAGAPAGKAKAGDVEVTKNGAVVLGVSEDDTDLAGLWLRERIEKIRDNPEMFWLILEKWAHRVAILALPVSALILSLLFVFQRRFYVFDHLVFSMHSLSFQLLLLTGILLASIVTGPVIWWLILLSPVHLFVHMRGTYGTGVFLTLVRMWLLWFLTTIAFSLLAVLWLWLGVNEMAGH